MTHSLAPPMAGLRQLGWLLLALGCLMAGLLVPAVSWSAERTDCPDADSQERADEGQSSLQAAYTPCPVAAEEERSLRDTSPSYNVCFLANPIPMSTMPRWLARQQAQDAVSLVLGEIHGLHLSPSDSAEAATTALWQVSAPHWLEDVIERLANRRGMTDNQNRMCIEGAVDEHCDPVQPGSLSSWNFTPAPPRSDDHDVPILWRPGENLFEQPPLVDLRVGPAAEHRTLPERPPQG